MNEKRLRLRAADVFCSQRKPLRRFLPRRFPIRRAETRKGFGRNRLGRFGFAVGRLRAERRQSMPHLPAHKRKLRPRTPASRGRRRAAAFHMRWSRDTPLRRRAKKSADAFCFRAKAGALATGRPPRRRSRRTRLRFRFGRSGQSRCRRAAFYTPISARPAAPCAALPAVPAQMAVRGCRCGGRRF